MARYVMNLNTQQVAHAMGHKLMHNLFALTAQKPCPANGNSGEQFGDFCKSREVKINIGKPWPHCCNQLIFDGFHTGQQNFEYRMCIIAHRGSGYVGSVQHPVSSINQ